MNNTIVIIKIVQINLQSCRASTNLLVSYMEENDIDIAVIQDCYLLKGRVVGFPQGWLQYFSSSLNSGILIRNNLISAIEILKNENSVFLALTRRTGSLVLGSQYSPPSGNLEEDLNGWVDKLQDMDIVITGDFNAKNPNWGYERTDRRGNLILETCVRNNLVIVNNPLDKPTYDFDNRKGYPDLTMCAGHIKDKIINWKVDDQENGSGHNYIRFEIVEEF